MLCVATLTSCHEDHVTVGGPLFANKKNSGFGIAFGVHVGESYSFSDAQLHNSGQNPVWIDSVELVDAKGIELIGELVGTKPGPQWPSGSPGFPPPYKFPMRPPSETPIPAGAPATPLSLLVLGLRVSAPGVSTATGIRLAYHDSDGHRYQTIIPARWPCALRSSTTSSRPTSRNARRHT